MSGKGRGRPLDLKLLLIIGLIVMPLILSFEYAPEYESHDITLNNIERLRISIPDDINARISEGPIALKGVRNPVQIANAENYLGDSFILNEGQIQNRDIIFHSESAYFTRDSVVIRVFEQPTIKMMTDKMQDKNQRFSVYKMIFTGSNQVIPVGEEPIDTSFSFFLGNDSARWISNAKGYKSIFYHNIYSNIDIRFRLLEKGIKYDILVHPGGNASDIRIRYDGASIKTDGIFLYIDTPSGKAVEGELLIYQQDDVHMMPVGGKFVKINNTISFSIDEYNKEETLIIDPLIFSTFLGGRWDDSIMSVDLSSDNYIYVAGQTDSYDFPTTPGSYDVGNSRWDAFIARFSPNGSLLTSTFLGGSNGESDVRIKIASSIIIVGTTSSNDFPVTWDAYDNSFGNKGYPDIFMTILNKDCNLLYYSTFIGGSDAENSPRICLDSPMGNLYMAGITTSSDFPVTFDAYCTTYKHREIFVLKFNLTQRKIIFSTFIGGEKDEEIPYDDISVDSYGNIYLAGHTESPDFPTTVGAYDTSFNGEYDIFILKLSADGSRLLYSTFLGTNGFDGVGSYKVDLLGNVLITGGTNSSDFPITDNAYCSTINPDPGQGNEIILIFNPENSKLIYSTYIGDAIIFAMQRDPLGRIYFTGFTTSAHYPVTPGAYETQGPGDGDVVFTVMNPNCTEVVYSTFIGGSGFDKGNSIAIDSSGCAYIAGYTESPDFPTTRKAYDKNYSGGGDAFVLKINPVPYFRSPRNLSAEAGYGYVRLNWTPPKNAHELPISNYLIYRGPDEENLSLHDRTGNVSFYNDTSVVNGVRYWYAVAAWSPGVEGE
ncbi:MAG: SBBP repeat-containing protein, partial [Thermoplasmata archaeon]